MTIEAGTPDREVPLQVDVSAAQAAWLEQAARATGQTQSDLVRQGIQLLRKATSYKTEAG